MSVSAEMSIMAKVRRECEDARLGAALAWSDEWLAENCVGDGWDPHPLLAGPGLFGLEGSATMTGLIVDGRGSASHATFTHSKKGAA